MNEPFVLKECEDKVVAVVNNLIELRDNLVKSEEFVIKHHVNDEKNDFATWIYESLGMGSLAFKVALVSGSELEVKNQLVNIFNKELNNNSFMRRLKFFRKS